MTIIEGQRPSPDDDMPEEDELIAGLEELHWVASGLIFKIWDVQNKAEAVGNVEVGNLLRRHIDYIKDIRDWALGMVPVLSESRIRELAEKYKVLSPWRNS